MWGRLKCFANNLLKWVFPDAGGPWIRILLGLKPLNLLNSSIIRDIFLTIPSLQCQLNLNLRGRLCSSSASSGRSSY